MPSSGPRLLAQWFRTLARAGLRVLPWFAFRKQPTSAPKWQKVQRGPLRGSELLVTADYRVFRLMIDGRYDEYLIAPLDRHRNLVAGGTIWDVGAHIGYDSLLLAAIGGPRSRVIAFEPNPFNARRFMQHLHRNPGLARRIELRVEALLDRCGTTELHFSEDVDNGSSSVSHVAEAALGKHDCTENILEVSCSTIDQLVFEGEIPAPCLIKLDVEGAEAAVLRGGQRVLASYRPLLAIEVHSVEQSVEVVKLLCRLKYEVEVLDTWNKREDRAFLWCVAAT